MMAWTRGGINISALTAQDVAEVAEIQAFAHGGAWVASAIAQTLAATGGLGFCVRSAAESPSIRAFCLGRVILDEAELLTIVTRPKHRGLGHASALLAAFIDHLTDNGITRMHLEVAENNAAALSLYQCFGLETVGRRKGYYEQGALDAILMSRPLVQNGSRVTR